MPVAKPRLIKVPRKRFQPGGAIRQPFFYQRRPTMRKRIMVSSLLCGAAVAGALVAFGQSSPEHGPVIIQRGSIGSAGQGNAIFWRTDGEGGQRRDAELSAKITEELQNYTAAKDDSGREKAKKQLQ